MNEKRIIDVSLDNEVIHVQVLDYGGEQDVALTIPNMDDVLKDIMIVAKKLESIKDAITPDEVSVEFGIGMTLKSGRLTSVLVDGEGDASIKVKLTWKK